ncbi:MAG TPA: bifunctional adenosylcobinamide kinase/adenosylcobinamide-phosphate guanylyltransferase [Candidatus Limnocylindria bacterium]|nr:bifunctional adenosylcobinamide kinase/adenosylcobinamide-phosphate guanylyltransferase [Candidatus Limnocylindria bacterium]
MSERVLVLGGASSGKSRFALDRARALGGERVTFIATARSGDPGMEERIAAHRAERPAAWPTLEGDADLAGAIAAARAGDVLLVDSLTLWVAAALEGGAAVDDLWVPVRLALLAWTSAVVLVSDEVGHGVVPATASGRRFREALGRVNQRAAELADEAWLVVAGLAVPLRARS